MNRWVIEGWGEELGRSLSQDLKALIRLLGYVQEQFGPEGSQVLLRGAARSLGSGEGEGMQLLRDVLAGLEESQESSGGRALPRGRDALAYLAAMVSESGRRYGRSLLAVQDRMADILSLEDQETQERLIEGFSKAAKGEIEASDRTVGIAVSILSRVNSLLRPPQGAK